MLDFWGWFWIVYGTGCIATLVPCARWYLRHGCDDGEAADLAMAGVLAIITVPFWPLAVPLVWIVAVLRADRADTGRRT